MSWTSLGAYTRIYIESGRAVAFRRILCVVAVRFRGASEDLPSDLRRRERPNGT